MNKLYFGDNLRVLREHVASESVDLVYLDPPFNSEARYNVLFRSPNGEAAAAQAGAFLDFWSWHTGEAEAAHHEIMTRVGGQTATLVSALRAVLGESDMMAYLVMMAIRLVELRRVLKPSGSIYLHCDPTASHYLKLLLDGIFGPDRFLNELIWKRTGSHGSSKRWGPVHDVVLFYSASRLYTWNRITQPYEPGYIEAKYRHEDSRGRFQDVSLTGAGTRKGASGLPWRGHNPTARGRHWAVPAAIGEGLAGFDAASPQEKLAALDRAALLYWPESRNGEVSFPRVRQYVGHGVPVQDCIVDIPAVNSQARERLGYPTQKPVALLDRIIRASSDEGQVVLDPFCGCGTTVHAAEGARRRWIGIDVSIHAVHVIQQRIEAAFGPNRVPRPEGIPADYASAATLARSNPFQFQWWCNYLLGAHRLNEIKRGPDRGIDGELFFPNGPGRSYGRLIISVKAGQTGPAHVRELRGVVERERAEMGIFVCLDRATPAMEREAVVAGFANVVHGRMPRIQIVAISDWFDGRRPHLPPLEQLPYAAFTEPKRGAKRRPDPDAPELPLSFRGDAAPASEGIIRHLNPRTVRSVA